MTPKEKAEELVNKFLPQIISADRYNYNVSDTNQHIAKQCALIAVDEILLDKKVGYSKDIIEEKQYWLKVKTEIENL